jgi:hypothetical protein
VGRTSASLLGASAFFFDMVDVPHPLDLVERDKSGPSEEAAAVVAAARHAGLPFASTRVPKAVNGCSRMQAMLSSPRKEASQVTGNRQHNKAPHRTRNFASRWSARK